MPRHEQVTEHAVGVPLPYAGVRGVGRRGVLDVAGGGELPHRVERHRTEVDDAPPWRGDHMEAAEGEVPGARVYGRVAPEVEATPVIRSGGIPGGGRRPHPRITRAGPVPPG